MLTVKDLRRKAKRHSAWAIVGSLVSSGVAFGAAGLLAQEASAQFDVVSIKPNRSSTAEGSFRGSPGGRFQWTNVPVSTIIGAAYQRFSFDEREIVGAPSWVTEEHFDVIAQLGGPAPPVDPDGFPSRLLALFRGMLEERFQLKTHWETRQGPIYVLTTTRTDHSPGPALKPVDAGCAAAMSNLTTGKPVVRRESRGPDCTFGGAPGILQANAVTIDMLARNLGGLLHREVVDRTGLAGSFDADLRFRPDTTAAPDSPPPSGDAPSIFTALQEQLGLKLTAERGPVQVLVIDRIERPTPD